MVWVEFFLLGVGLDVILSLEMNSFEGPSVVVPIAYRPK